jgi:hypothetical protein
MPQMVDPRYIDGNKLWTMLATLFPGQPYAAEVGHPLVAARHDEV